MKSTPAASRIFLDITADPSIDALFQQQNQNQNQTTNALSAFTQDLTQEEKALLGLLTGQSNTGQAAPNNAAANAKALSNAIRAQMIATLKQDLLRNRVGYPVITGPEDADLHLSGVFRNGTNGVTLDWQLVEVRSKAIVAAGSESQMFFMGNIEPFADHILANLLEIDIDRYAKAGGGGVTAPEAPNVAGLGDPPKSSHDGSNTWVVAIGIERYRDQLPEAKHAEADAQAFARFAEVTLGVPRTQIKLLVGDRAGRSDIASVLEEWLPRNARKSGGKVFVYFSGHGAPDTATGDAYLVPYDADPAYLKTKGYAVKDVYANLGKLRGQTVVTMLDACFSGSGTRSVIPEGTRPLVPVKTPSKAPRGLISFAAAEANQTTGAAPKAPHGLFTYHLLRGLYGDADTNGDRAVDLAELERYVTARVSRDASLANREQSPSLTLPPNTTPGSVGLVRGLK